MLIGHKLSEALSRVNWSTRIAVGIYSNKIWLNLLLSRYYRMFLLSFPSARLLCRTGSLHRPVYPVTAALLRGTMQETLFIHLNSCFYAIGQRTNIPDLLRCTHFVTGF
jgi:hypothetical protein